MSRKKILLVSGPALFITGLVIYAGCSLLPGAASGGAGTLQLLVTDKPFPYAFIDEATITIMRIEVRPADDDQTDGSDGTSEAAPATQDQTAAQGDPDGDANDSVDDGFVVLMDQPRTIDLLDLRNGRTDLLANAVVDAQKYDLMRLIVTEGTVTLNTGETFTLKVPSGEQTGIKLHYCFTIEAGGETVLLLDVDMSRAFLAIPSGDIEDPSTISSFKFAPSFAMRLINLVEAGSIQGTVTADTPEMEPLADVSITAFRGEEEITSSASEPDGTYVLSGLPVGDYRIEFSLAGHETGEQTNIDVSAGESETAVDIELTPLP